MNRWILVLALSVSPACFAFEDFPTLDAAQFAPPDLLSGPHFKVAPQVTIDGYMAKFEMETDYGPLTARGTEMLRVRVREMPAIAELSDVSQTKAFTDAAAKSAMVPVDFAKNLATDPKQTMNSVANGVGALFASAGRAVKQGSEYVSDKATDSGTKSTSESSGGSFNDDPIGYNKAKREWAKKLGVDPYSTNPVLEQKLSAAAQASFAGGFAVGLAVGAVIGPAQYAVSLDESTRDAVWDKSPGELEAINEAKLQEMGISGRPVRDFLRTPSFTPTLSTALVSALKSLPNVRGGASIVVMASQAQSEVQARFMVHALQLLALYEKRGTRIAEIRVSGRVPVGVTGAGFVVVPAAIDYVPWTEQVAGFANRKELAGKGHLLLLTGTLSPEAKKEFATRGWKVEEGVQLQS